MPLWSNILPLGSLTRLAIVMGVMREAQTSKVGCVGLTNRLEDFRIVEVVVIKHNGLIYLVMEIILLRIEYPWWLLHGTTSS